MQEDRPQVPRGSPQVDYRIQSERAFEITNKHSERRERAILIAIIRSCLFGKKRYQSIILNSSLNNLFNTLRIAAVLNTKVPNLAMIIRFKSFTVVEVMTNHQSNEIKRTKVEIKLTTKPSEEDKKQPGFNAGTENIDDPITTELPRRYSADNTKKRNQGKEGNKTSKTEVRDNFKYRQNRNDQLEDEDYNRNRGETGNRTGNNRRGRGSERGRNRGGYRYKQDRGGDRDNNSVSKSREGKTNSNEAHEQTKHGYKKQHLAP